MLLQTSQKLSEKVQQRQTTQADGGDYTPRNISDGLRLLKLSTKQFNSFSGRCSLNKFRAIFSLNIFGQPIMY